LSLREALEPPLDVEGLLDAVPELALSRYVEQSPYHHLDTFEHTLEVVRNVERELEVNQLEARVGGDRVEGLRLAAALHDVAKPVTRGEIEDRVLFVSHDSLGAPLVRRVCRRLGLSASLTDPATTLTALHLKIGFMASHRTDYLPRLKREHLERHRELCVEFLRVSRELGPHPEPDYGELARRLSPDRTLEPADVGYAASTLRLLVARGMDGETALANASLLL
jgi:poly(A) polymerase